MKCEGIEYFPILRGKYATHLYTDERKEMLRIGEPIDNVLALFYMEKREL